MSSASVIPALQRLSTAVDTEGVDHADAHADVHERPDRVVGHPGDGAHGAYGGADDADPAGELRAHEDEEAANQHHDADAQPDPRVVLEVRPKDAVLEVLRKGALVGERPDRI